MSDVDDKIAAIADLQRVNAEQLKLLLTRDPRKELIYGPQFDPNVLRRVQKNEWQTLIMVNTAVARVFTSPISQEEISIRYMFTFTTAMLRVEMDNNANFSNIRPNFATGTVYLPAKYSDNSTYVAFDWQIPCLLRWIRLSLVDRNGVIQAWTANTPLSMGFHGQ